MSSPGPPPAAPTFDASKCAWIMARAVASSIENLRPASSARHRRSGADRLGRCRDLGAERPQRADIDLRERRERLDGVVEDVEWDVGADRQRCLLQPLARLGAERVGAGQPLAVAEECQEAVLLGIRARVGGALRNLRQRDHRAEAAGGGTNRSGLWVGVDDSRNGLVVGLSWLPQDVRGDYVALVLADMRQRPEPVDVADRPQAFAGAQMWVDRNSVGVRLDADRLEADPANPRAPAGGDEQPVAAQFAPVVELEDVVLAVASRGGRVRGQDELDALAAQSLAERLTQRCRLTGEEVL